MVRYWGPRKKLMSLLICVSDTMFAQCCDKGNCHFSELGQKRFYRIACLTFHVSHFLSKTHSFVYLCVCVDICTCVHAETPEEGIRYLFSVFTCIFESGSLFKPGTCIFLATLKASTSQRSSWLQSPRNRVIDMSRMTSLLMWVLGSEFGSQNCESNVFNHQASCLFSFSFAILCYD